MSAIVSIPRNAVKVVFHFGNIKELRNPLFGLGVRPTLDPAKARMICEALTRASQPKPVPKPATPALKPVAPTTTVHNWPTQAEIEARYNETTFSKDEVQFARLMGLTFAEARFELSENANLANQTAEYDRENPAPYEAGEVAEARLVEPVYSESDFARPRTRHSRVNAAKSRRMEARSAVMA